jgi:replicative DNA helicase
MDTSIYNDSDSEREIIQALYLNPELIYQIDIIFYDFTNAEYRSIYEAMLQLYGDGITEFDIKVIHDLKPELDQMKIHSVFTEAITSANIQYHVKKVKNATFNRRCREKALQIQTSVGKETFLSNLEKHISELYEIQRGHKQYSLNEILSNIQVRIQEAKKKAQYGILTGFYNLNEACVGMCPGHVWVLAGYTSFGKSTLLSQMIDDICKAGHSMLVFSVEDSKEDKLIRLLATKTGISIRSIVRGFGDEERLRLAREDIEKFRLYIYDDVYTLDDMALKIKKHKIQGGIDIVAIDFVQNIITGNDGIYDSMREVAIRLQKMAKQHYICILALSQITEGKEKGSIALRGAQEIASTADIVLWIDRKPDSKEFDLIIRKNRPFGVTGKISMRFADNWTKIIELNK